MISVPEFGLKVNLKDGTPFVMYTPTPKQLEFHRSEISKFCAVGNRGGGKSVMLRFDAHMRALACPGANLILVRKTYKDLLKSHVYFQGLPWGSLEKEMELLGGRFNKTDYLCHYPNGSKLFLSYVGHESDALNLLSAEFLAAYFDEISTIPWDFFTKLAASVRVPTSSNWRGVIRAATNFLGGSTPEILQYFVNKNVDFEDDQDYDPRQWGSIQINMEDNPHIPHEQYRKDLISLNLPPHVYKAWVEGTYYEEGTLFNFHPTKDEKPYHVIKEIDIPALVSKAQLYRVYDHGYRDPAYCAWIAHLGNRYIVFHEKVWYETHVPQIAEGIKQEEELLGIRDEARNLIPRIVTYCDPSIDVKTGDVRTIKDLFEEHGIAMDCSVNNRELFASAFHTALAEEAEPGTPKLQIYANGPRIGCPYLVKAIPLQKFDPKHPQKLADNRHDHPVVAIAYFLISHSSEDRRAMAAQSTKPWMRPKLRPSAVLGSYNTKNKRTLIY